MSDNKIVEYTIQEETKNDVHLKQKGGKPWTVLAKKEAKSITLEFEPVMLRKFELSKNL